MILLFPIVSWIFISILFVFICNSLLTPVFQKVYSSKNKRLIANSLLAISFFALSIALAYSKVIYGIPFLRKLFAETPFGFVENKFLWLSIFFSKFTIEFLIYIPLLSLVYSILFIDWHEKKIPILLSYLALINSLACYATYSSKALIYALLASTITSTVYLLAQYLANKTSSQNLINGQTLPLWAIASIYLCSPLYFAWDEYKSNFITQYLSSLSTINQYTKITLLAFNSIFFALLLLRLTKSSWKNLPLGALLAALLINIIILIHDKSFWVS